MSRQIKDGYPSSIICIITTEFCERFSFCGLRTILSLYLRDELDIKENSATVVYHVFIMACYLVPVIGALLADGCLGRYRTILYFSVIYFAGSIQTCLAATPPLHLPPLASTIVGLALIAVGTGGIKPCVATFGGDQFSAQQQEHLHVFFSLFYFAINLGGMAGMLAAPLLRQAVSCFGEDTCYLLSFGLPTGLMLFALVMFVAGKRQYRMKRPRGNVLEFFGCTARALGSKIRSGCRRNDQHWLDAAADSYNPKLIADTKALYSLLLLYAPLPVFWSLFDQQGSRWTFQASRTNGTVLGVKLMPDQVQVVNPIIVLALIPLFERSKCPLLASPLRRMQLGGIAASAAFVASGFLEMKLEHAYPTLPTGGKSALNIINSLPCVLKIDTNAGATELEPAEMYTFKNVPPSSLACVAFATKWCGRHILPQPLLELQVELEATKVAGVIIGIDDRDYLAACNTDPVDYSKSLDGKPKVRVAVMHSTTARNVTVTLKAEDGAESKADVFIPSNHSCSMSEYTELQPGAYTYEVHSNSDTLNGNSSLLAGAVYSIIVREYRGSIDFLGVYASTPPNTVHMGWMMPQFVLMSVAEILFVVSGLQFTFSQAPSALKTVAMAAWYLSVAVGNLLVVVITRSRLFESQAFEFFFFAGILVVGMAFFAGLASRYEAAPLDIDSSSSDIVLCENAPLLNKNS